MLSYDGKTLMPTFKGSITQTELLEIVRHERETFGGEKVPAEQIAPGRRAALAERAAGAQRLGRAADPDGNPMFDADGKLVNTGCSRAGRVDHGSAFLIPLGLIPLGLILLGLIPLGLIPLGLIHRPDLALRSLWLAGRP